MLERIKKEYKINDKFYRKLKRSINYTSKNNDAEVNNFVNELP